MSTDHSPIDQPTLRIHLDRLLQDKIALTNRLKEEQGKMEAAKTATEQFSGALGYNQGLIDAITKELKDLSEAAFTGPGRSVADGEVKS